MSRAAVVKLAQSNSTLKKKLQEIAKLDSYLSMPSGVPIAVDQWAEGASLKQRNIVTAQYNDLFDEVYQLLQISKVDSEEFGVWLSFNIQEIVRELSRRRWSIFGFFR